METSAATYKKATAGLDEAARARLRGPFTSGTAPRGRDYPGVDDDDRLVDLVHEFYYGYGERGADAVAREAESPGPAEGKDAVREALADAMSDAAAARIRAVAERAVRDAAGPGAVCGEVVRKLVVERLRSRGFDAGVCKSSWEGTGSIPAGSHEYVDVTSSTGAAPRYIVEVNIAAEFEIARPSAEYQDLLLSLPPVLVASPEAFSDVAAAMCAAAAASIRGAGMHLPPWRRARYVQAKWSGPYERAVADPRGARTVPSGGRNHCGIEIERREMAAMGREGLVSMRPLFRGL
ncbi:hypothetical protein GUJ93_ZPchr0006g44655 [Zizania palustris]|uniref:DUF506 family protein n=1 Tax=Zizania palustris TaxID=103762 RepID=A0A8J5SHC0_ZIZPA|nr:hypothetical protein GUJ93_ZPchr0006g44655 [Zizania palustris]